MIHLEGREASKALQADGEYISKDKMLMFLNDMRYGIAPDETVADGDERREREAQVDVLDDLMELVEQMPSVAIPPAEPKTEQFAKWVATEIFDEWEYNKDSFAEIACRKLAKLGIVRAKGDEWELIESKESDHTCHTCKHYTSGERDGSCGSYICKGYSNWESEG